MKTALTAILVSPGFAVFATVPPQSGSSRDGSMVQPSTCHIHRPRRRRHLVAFQSRIVRRRNRSGGIFLEYPPDQTPAEELANALTHAAAAVTSLAGGIWLIAAVVRREGPLMTMGCAVYAASLLVVFTMSALSHWVQAPRLRGLFRALDQASIYLLIAGSATPFLIRYLLPLGWDWVLPVLWGLALLWAWDKIRGHGVNSISVVSYVSLAWLPMIAARPILGAMPAGCAALVVTMGACYMGGIVFLIYDDRRRFFHAIWHVFVIGASACTFVAIAIYVV
jgi:hemolysin III